MKRFLRKYCLPFGCRVGHIISLKSHAFIKRIDNIGYNIDITEVKYRLSTRPSFQNVYRSKREEMWRDSARL